ncbi:MAG TPA: hypothetical protein PLO24_01550 [Bacteroidales bacterium]|nr:hypothetical protein [Bacteroidales bacterium]
MKIVFRFNPADNQIIIIVLKIKFLKYYIVMVSIDFGTIFNNPDFLSRRRI